MLLIRRAFAANFVPAVVLWCAALALFLAWTFSAGAHAALVSLSQLKERSGIGFSMIAQAVAVGLLPFLFQRFQRGTHRKADARDLPFLLGMWALQNAVVDVFYRFQAVWWGSGNDFQTLLIKVVCDMGVFAPLLAMPFALCVSRSKMRATQGQKPARCWGRAGLRSA